MHRSSVPPRTQVELFQRGNQSASPAEVQDAGAQRFHAVIAEVIVRKSDARAEWVLRVAAEDLAGGVCNAMASARRRLPRPPART